MIKHFNFYLFTFAIPFFCLLWLETVSRPTSRLLAIVAWGGGGFRLGIFLSFVKFRSVEIRATFVIREFIRGRRNTRRSERSDAISIGQGFSIDRFRCLVLEIAFLVLKVNIVFF